MMNGIGYKTVTTVLSYYSRKKRKINRQMFTNGIIQINFVGYSHLFLDNFTFLTNVKIKMFTVMMAFSLKNRESRA